MIKFLKIDENVRYNLDYIYKTEILEGKVSEKAFSFGSGRKVFYVKFYSSISDKDSWESDYFNSIEEANEWLDNFISKYSA
jgi:ribosomal protein S24E